MNMEKEHKKHKHEHNNCDKEKCSCNEKCECKHDKVEEKQIKLEDNKTINEIEIIL